MAAFDAPTETHAKAARVLPDAQGRTLLPGIVRYAEPTEATNAARVESVGQDAKDRAAEFPRRTISSIQRLMGRSRRDADRAGDLVYLPYEVIEGPNATARVALAPGSALPPRVSTFRPAIGASDPMALWACSKSWMITTDGSRRRKSDTLF